MGRDQACDGRGQDLVGVTGPAVGGVMPSGGRGRAGQVTAHVPGSIPCSLPGEIDEMDRQGRAAPWQLNLGK